MIGYGFRTGLTIWSFGGRSVNGYSTKVAGYIDGVDVMIPG